MKTYSALMQWPLAGGFLGLLQGLIISASVHAFSPDTPLVSALIVFLTFPLVGFLFKLPSLDRMRKWFGILAIMGFVYAVPVGLFVELLSQDRLASDVWIFGFQLEFSIFVALAFYCAFVESEKCGFSYPILFRESWQLLQKFFLGNLLVLLLYGLCLLAAQLFNLLNIALIEDIVYNADFQRLILPVFFGIALAILHQHEELLKKLRAILLAFCHLLYPLFVIICLSFLLTIPFAGKKLVDVWSIINLLAIFNIFLINGVFQQGDWILPPYRKPLLIAINALIMLITVYLLYDLQFPLKNLLAHINHAGGSNIDRSFSDLRGYAISFLFSSILCAYHLGYTGVVLFNRGSWLDLMKRVNIVLACVTAFIYWVIIFPWGIKAYFG